MPTRRNSRARPKVDAGGGGRTIAQSLQEYGRGAAGGLIFSLPLLYTMEVWWAGHNARPWRIVANFAAAFVLLLGYNRYAGLRRDASFTEVVIDSIEELGLGLVLSALILWLLGRVSFDMAAHEAIGRVVVEALTVAVGVSVGTAQLGGDEDEGMSSRGKDADEAGFTGQTVIAVCGAVLFAANVAPTEEIVMLGVEITAWHALGLAMLSLLLAALVLFHVEFRGARRPAVTGNGGAATTAAGTVVTYAVALASSAAILYLFGRFEGQALFTCVTQTVVLGVAATLGASAGRLLLQ